jgi:hypothetical protein
MSAVTVFILGLCLAALLSVGVVWYLNTHLKGILTELCGTERRADFWIAFSNVILILVPMVFAMQFHSAADDNVPVFFQLIYQLKWSFIGLVTSMLALGAKLSLFIRRDSIRPPSQ